MVLTRVKEHSESFHCASMEKMSGKFPIVGSVAVERKGFTYEKTMFQMGTLLIRETTYYIAKEEERITDSCL